MYKVGTEMRRVMTKLAGLSRILEVTLVPVSNILLILITGVVFTEVILRYIFGISYSILQAFSPWSMVWIGYLMMGVTEKGRRHVRVDFIPTRLPERYQTALLVVGDMACLAFSIFLFWAGIEMTQITKQAGLLSVTGEIRVPIWIVRLIVPLSAVLLAFFSIEHLIMDIRSLGKHTRGK